jgi:ribulose-5-phosphate 4-epimerase/fuculose-1-phosphate aldolase
MRPARAPASVLSESEGQARVELAACYRIFAQLGWTELIYNHITLRLPGPQKHFLINPFGLLIRMLDRVDTSYRN